MELVPNLHWIEGRASNIYLLIDEAGLTLVDTGMPGDAKVVFNYIRKIGRQEREVSSILITHADYDHAGSAAAIQSRSNAVVYASAQTAGFLVKGKSPKHMNRVIQFISDHLAGYRPVALEVIQIVAEGETVWDHADWQALATPGHTHGHYAFYSQTQGIVFTGDALNTRRDRLQVSSKRITADKEAARQSAMRLLRLNPAVFACGHGRPSLAHNGDEVMALYRDLQGQMTSQAYTRTS